MDFAAGVSHEIRTPLAVIKSAAYNLQSGVVSDKESILEYAAILQGEAAAVRHGGPGAALYGNPVRPQEI